MHNIPCKRVEVSTLLRRITKYGVVDGFQLHKFIIYGTVVRYTARVFVAVTLRVFKYGSKRPLLHLEVWQWCAFRQVCLFLAP